MSRFVSEEPTQLQLDARRVADMTPAERKAFTRRALGALRSARARGALPDHGAAYSRAIAWAAWRAQANGIKIAAGAVGRLDEYERVVTFCTKRHVSGYWTAPDSDDAPYSPLYTRGRGKNREVWVDAHDEYEPVAPPIPIPHHCLPVRSTEAWHAAHQHGCTPEEAGIFARGDRWGRESLAELLSMPVHEWRERQEAQRRANEWRYLDDGADEIARVEREAVEALI